MEVFIVPYDKTINIENGFTKLKHYNDIWSKYNDTGIYVDKNIADKSSAMQQIIPYILIRNEDNRYLTATLNNKDGKIISMGFGNNLIPIDGVSQPLFKGTVRTLFEDVIIEELLPIKLIGTVRDMTSNDKQLGYAFLIDNVTKDVSLSNELLEKR